MLYFYCAYSHCLLIVLRWYTPKTLGIPDPVNQIDSVTLGHALWLMHFDFLQTANVGFADEQDKQ